MAYTLALQASFGPSNAGVGTVGYAILNADGTTAVARTTSGVVDLGAGFYGKAVSFADDFRGYAKWDTGTGSPLYAVAPVEPPLPLTNATVVASGSTTSTVRLSSPWTSGEASGRTLYIGGRGYNLGTSANHTYSITPSWTVPADGTAVLIGPLAASTPDALSAVATNVTAIKAKTDAQPSTWPTNFSALVISAGGVVSVDKTGYSLSSAGLDSVVVEAGMNARQALSIIAAPVAGVVSGNDTTTTTIKGAGVATTRIVATTDGSGNRSAVTLTLPS